MNVDDLTVRTADASALPLSEGDIVRRYEPDVTPERIMPDLRRDSPEHAPRP